MARSISSSAPESARSRDLPWMPWQGRRPARSRNVGAMSIAQAAEARRPGQAMPGMSRQEPGASQSYPGPSPVLESAWQERGNPACPHAGAGRFSVMFWKCAFPTSAVRYPASRNASMKVRALLGRGTPFVRTPAAPGIRPVAMAARWGMQTGSLTKKRSKTTPPEAIESMFGVLTHRLP
jgi:hypothetical protein